MKHKREVLTLMLVGVVSSSTTRADPPTCTKIWVGPSSAEVWSECDFWYDLEEEEVGNCPSNQDVACITDGAEVTIYFQQFAPAEAKAIYVDSTSELVIYDADSLVLCGGSSCVPSHIDGGLEIYDGGGKLKIGQNVTINGSGHIEFGLEGGTAPAEIEAVSGTPTLTLGSGLTLEGFGKIETKLTNNGTIEATGGELTFYDDFTLGGTLLIKPTATVFITNNQTVPSAAIVELETSGGNVGKLKPKAGSSPTLTVSSGGVIKGAGELHIKPVNNGTVAARNGTLDLKLGGEGSGKWTSETSTGNLLVSAEVKGAGTWELDDNAGAKITIAATSQCLSGNVNISLGTLDVDQEFRTTQQLTIGGPNSLIDVAGGKAARFSVPTHPSCVGG